MIPAYHDGERLSSCPYGCTDQGFVFIECRDPRAIEYYRLWLKLDDEVIAKRFSITVACACGKGQHLADKGLRRLRPDRDYIFSRTASEQPKANWKTQNDFAKTGF